MSMYQNVQDGVYQAIEEYSKTIKKEACKKFTDEERTGLFYTILRRYFNNLTGTRRRGLLVDDFECTFRENGELKSFKIKRNFMTSWNVSDKDLTYESIKSVGENHPTLYPSPIMNEIAGIVNSIKR